MHLEPSLHTFLHGDVDGRDFHHADHVRMAFEILRRHDFLDAAKAYSTALKDIARRAGSPGAYHATITLAFLALIAERMAGHEGEEFAAFAVRNPDLLEKSVLRRWYRTERLQSDVARRIFVLPEERIG